MWTNKRRESKHMYWSRIRIKVYALVLSATIFQKMAENNLARQQIAD